MTKSRLLKLLKNKEPLVFDGAMGTVLMQRGFGHVLAEKLNLENPKLITAIHHDYVKAGADIIETNTFNASQLKLEELGLGEKINEINYAAVKNARAAAVPKTLIAGSIGPTGKLMEPLGALSFDEAYQSYKKQVEPLFKAGVDLFIIETISDIQETKAALLAIKDTCDLPVICSLTFNADGRTLTGTDIFTAAVTVKELGGSVFSINCSIGPDGILELYKKFYKNLGELGLPLMVMPNAGLPEIENDQAVYKMTPKEFAAIMDKFRAYGVSIYGGCCGTTPPHIEALTKKIKHKKITFQKTAENEVYFTSRTKTLRLSEISTFLKIGESLNPTARKQFALELKSGQDNYLREQAKLQTEAGADLLDINVGVPELDQKTAIKKCIHTLSTIIDTPLCLDSDDPAVLEEGLKNYPGIPLINSVNGKTKSLERIFPLAQKYGANLIALALDDKGIPEKATARLKIVKKIIAYAKNTGFSLNKIFIDALVMSVSSNPEGPQETLKITAALKKQGIKTSLGVSNVSFGLPERKNINNAFLYLLQKAGLSAGIINVSTFSDLKKLSASEQAALKLLQGKDPGGKQYISTIKPMTEGIKKETVAKKGLPAIHEAILNGEEHRIEKLIQEELNNTAAEKILNETLLPALEKVGNLYSSGKYYLPQMIASANTMKKAFNMLKDKLAAGGINKKGTAIICTVEGDIHDIGKNIVALMLENSGYQVIDLGKDVPAEKIVETAKKQQAQVILLSALLTTTMLKMKEVKQKLLSAGLDIPVMVGGAVVTAEYAKNIGANYSTDAATAVQTADKLVNKQGL